MNNKLENQLIKVKQIKTVKKFLERKDKLIKVFRSTYDISDVVYYSIKLSIVTILFCIVNLILGLSNLENSNVVTIRNQGDLDKYMYRGGEYTAIINTPIYFNDSFQDKYLGDLVYLKRYIKVEKSKTIIDNKKARVESYYEDIPITDEYVDYFYILDGTKLKLNNYTLLAILMEQDVKSMDNNNTQITQYIPNKIYKNKTLIASIKGTKITIIKAYDKNISKIKYADSGKILIIFVMTFLTSCIFAVYYIFLDSILNKFNTLKISHKYNNEQCIIVLHLAIIILNILLVHILFS